MTTQSDASGRIELSAGIPISITPSAGPWRIASPPTEAATTGDLWMYRSVAVDLHIYTSAGGEHPPLSQFVFDLVALGVPESTIFERSAPPWNLTWMRAHGLDSRTTRVDTASTTDDSGTLNVPGLRWLGLKARAPGWSSDLTEVPMPSTQADATSRVVVDVLPLAGIKGRVLDENGNPIAGATVRIQQMRRIRAEDVNVERLQESGMAFSIIARPGEPAIVTHSVDSISDETGEFETRRVHQGETLLVAYVPGYRPIRRLVDSDAGDIGEEMVTGRPVRGAPKVHVMRGGDPVGDTGIAVTDITDRDRQTLFVLRTDKSGYMSSEWLEVGRAYWLVPAGNGGGQGTGTAPPGRFVTWRGEAEIDLDKLASDLESFDRLPR